MRHGSSITGRRQIIKTEDDRACLIDAVKRDHPRNVAEALGLRPNTVRHYIRTAKDEMRTDLLAKGLDPIEAEELIHRAFYRDGAAIRTVTIEK